ncbi:MIP/aquaporin family protein [Brevibacillus daliensis]|uniref:MIP/aquaporin family protein n=1 Tax=Brevibacillus daliensis TaxID=2892995 RepID=UPI001E523B20|nr:MIP/aquaporin family protein [Brevibacillus daliensis]
MGAYTAEFIGTMIIILFGAGINSGLTLNKTLNQGANWVIVTFGWGFAVMLGVYASAPISGGHLNPALTIAFAIQGTFPWADVLPYIICQTAGAFVGATIVAAHYYIHFKATPKDINTRGIFATGPAIDNPPFNLLSEIIATFAFTFALLLMGINNFADGLNPLIIGFLIVVIGMAFGPTTGYAINPARDLGPRLAYFILPIPNKSGANWNYAWIPIVGPIIGAVLAIGVHTIL